MKNNLTLQAPVVATSVTGPIGPPGAGFTKPCALLKLDFLTSAYKKNACVSQKVQL